MYPILVLKDLPDLVGELAGDLDGVQAGNVAVEALPLGDPAVVGVREGDDALEDLRRAGLDLVLRVREVEEVVAVGAPFRSEALFRGLKSPFVSTRASTWGLRDCEKGGGEAGWRWEGMGGEGTKGRGRRTYAVGLDDGADHAGAEVALLPGRDEGAA